MTHGSGHDDSWTLTSPQQLRYDSWSHGPSPHPHQQLVPMYSNTPTPAPPLPSELTPAGCAPRRAHPSWLCTAASSPRLAVHCSELTPAGCAPQRAHPGWLCTAASSPRLAVHRSELTPAGCAPQRAAHPLVQPVLHHPCVHSAAAACAHGAGGCPPPAHAWPAGLRAQTGRVGSGEAVGYGGRGGEWRKGVGE